MKHFKFYNDEEKGAVALVNNKPLDLRHDIYNRSESFQWGYRGQGPHQLAIAILGEFLPRHEALFLAFKFEDDITSQHKQYSSWEIGEDEIISWIKNKEKEIIELNDKNKTYSLVESIIKDMGYYLSNRPTTALLDSILEMVNEDDLQLTQAIEAKINPVKHTCQELGITQKELANLLDVKPTAVSNWANGDIPKLAQIVLEQMLEIKDLKEKLNKVGEFKVLLNSL